MSRRSAARVDGEPGRDPAPGDDGVEQVGVHRPAQLALVGAQRRRAVLAAQRVGQVGDARHLHRAADQRRDRVEVRGVHLEVLGAGHREHRDGEPAQVGAGVVVEVGPEVTLVKPGDRKTAATRPRVAVIEIASGRVSREVGFLGVETLRLGWKAGKGSDEPTLLATVEGDDEGTFTVDWKRGHAKKAAKTTAAKDAVVVSRGQVQRLRLPIAKYRQARVSEPREATPALVDVQGEPPHEEHQEKDRAIVGKPLHYARRTDEPQARAEPAGADRPTQCVFEAGEQEPALDQKRLECVRADSCVCTNSFE